MPVDPPQPAATRGPSIKAVELPEFHGNPELDRLTARAWARNVANAKRLADWPTQKTVEFSLFVLRGNAAIWSGNLAESEDPCLRTWELFQTAFLERFHIKRTLAEKAKLRETLTLRPKEDVATFFDRCVQVQFQLDDSIWPEGTSPEVKKVSHDQAVELSFVSGLPSKIRELLVLEEGKDLNALRNLAIRAEASQRDQQKVFRTTPNMGVSAVHSPVNAIRGRGRTRGNFRSRGQYRGRGRGSRPSLDNPCFTCGEATHWHLECPQKSGTGRSQGRGRGPTSFSRGRGWGMKNTSSIENQNSASNEQEEELEDPYNAASTSIRVNAQPPPDFMLPLNPYQH